MCLHQQMALTRCSGTLLCEADRKLLRATGGSPPQQQWEGICCCVNPIGDHKPEHEDIRSFQQQVIGSGCWQYRPNRSTGDALATVLHPSTWTVSAQVRRLLVDFSSAFNTIIPRHLIDKLGPLRLNTTTGQTPPVQVPAHHKGVCSAPFASSNMLTTQP